MVKPVPRARGQSAGDCCPGHQRRVDHSAACDGSCATDRGVAPGAGGDVYPVTGDSLAVGLAGDPCRRRGGCSTARKRRQDRGIYRRAEFWMVGITVALTLNAMVILTICYPPSAWPVAASPPSRPACFLAVAGAGGALGKLTVALLADKLRPHTRWFAAAILLVKLVGPGHFWWMTDVTFLIVVSVAMMGFSGGAFLPMHPYLNSRYFKADIIGQVNGAQGPLFLPLGLVGAPLAGYVFDQTGSYTLVLVGLTVILLLAILSVLALPRSRF